MLVAGRFWREQKSKPYQLGLWWGTWLGTFSVMAVGLRFGELGFAEVFFRILASVPIFFGIGFIAGFIFRKLKPIAGGLKVAANTPSSISGASDADFAEAMAEIDESKMEKGLWARCFAESEGDIKKTKASYIRHRAIKLSKPINSDVNSEFVPQIVKNKIVTEIILFWDSFNTVGRVCIFLIIGLIILLNWTHLR